MAPTDAEDALIKAALPPMPEKRAGMTSKETDEWVNHIDEVSDHIKGIIDGTVTDFDAFDRKMELEKRGKEIRQEEYMARREKFFLYGAEGKGEGRRYKWWCKRCFVEYLIDLPHNKCTRCKQGDKMMTQEARREELMGKLADFKEKKSTHQFRKDKWNRWKKSQAMLKKSKYINYKAWEYWEPNTDTEDEGEPIVPKDNPEFLAMEADMNDRRKKQAEKAKTAERCRRRGNEMMKDGDFVGAIEHYDEGLEYVRSNKVLWTNKALAELKVFRWQDAIASCNKVIEYSEIFEDGFTKSGDACFKAFMRRATALRALHKWEDALTDVEDALKIFPKDREARDLYAKTKAAKEEACQASTLKSKGPTKADADDVNAPTEVEAEPSAPSGPVRVEIEESEDEEDDEILQAAPAAHASSLANFTRSEFQALLARLKKSKAERVLFCARGDGGSGSAQREDSRKIELKKIEEVVERSGLDGVLKDSERCSMLWKKHQGHVVPLRADVHKVDDFEDEGETKKAIAFVRTCAPRIVSILHVMATCSDHHCALTAPGVRHVWPLLTNSDWRQPVLELLMEWSQRTLTAKAMAEFAGRYPEPHLHLLVDAVSQETKENMLPPGFEDTASQAAQRLGDGVHGADAALEAVLEGLSAQSPAELAIATIGNVCLAGRTVPNFTEQAAPFCDELVSALSRHLKPLNRRICGRAAGSVCNVLRLGDPFTQAVIDQCSEPLVRALREETSQDSSSSTLKSMCEQSGLLGNGQFQLPGTGSGSSGRLLGALVNLLGVRPTAVPMILDLGALDVAVNLLDPEVDVAATDGDSDENENPVAVVIRASLLTSRLLTVAAPTLSLKVEADLLQRLFRTICKAGDFSVVKALVKVDADERTPTQTQMLDQLEIVVRMLTIIVTKTPAALDRLTGNAPRCEELLDDTVDIPVSAEPAVPFKDLAARLIKLVIALRPIDHVGPDLEGSALSRMRGNLALLFAGVCEAQSQDNASPDLRDLDLSPLVACLLETLKKERKSVQHNIGVCVTRLAQQPRYKQQVRDLNGIETLHQIHLPKVEAQKTKAAQQHRIETSTNSRKHEVAKRRAQEESLANLD